MSDQSEVESSHEENQETKTDLEPATAQQDAAEWTTASLNSLIHNVMSQTEPGEATPYYLREIDWETVRWGSHTATDCQKKWDMLLTKVRHYRTLADVATDMIGFLEKKKANAKVLQWNREIAKCQKKEDTPTPSAIKKKKKTKLPPGYPMKPRKSAYSIFSQDKMAELRTSFHGVELLVEVGRQWGNLSEGEKQKYIERVKEEKTGYIGKLQAYSANHPDDERIKQMIQEEEQARNTPKGKNKSKSTPSTSQNKQKTQAQNAAPNRVEETEDKSAENEITEETKSERLKDTEPSTSKESPSKSPKNKKIKKEAKLNMSIESMLDSGIETNATVTESPVKTAKKRPNEEGDVSTTSETPKKKKKKHKKQKRITGMQLFVEEKIDAYKLEHPDMDDEDVQSKLRRKYGKLSDKKTKKYEQIAAEMNLSKD